MEQPFLSIRNLAKQYSGHTALKDVSIDIPKQNIFGLLGPNGAGKTSLIRIINQITGPDNGEVWFDGEKLHPSHTTRIGYLPEERGLYRKMKLGEQAVYLARLKGLNNQEAHQRLTEWFERFDLMDWWDRRIEELSKGMAQKVQFITTIVHQPSLLILDEPFSGFDPINTDLIKQEILKLREAGTTVIFSTHNMESVEAICDRIALIHRSEKILEGHVDQIRAEHSAAEYEVTFKGNIIGFTNALWTQFKLLYKEEKDGFYKARIQLLRNSTLNQLLNVILPHVEVHGVREVIPSMNDIFIQLVNEEKEDHEQDPADHQA